MQTFLNVRKIARWSRQDVSKFAARSDVVNRRLVLQCRFERCM